MFQHINLRGSYIDETTAGRPIQRPNNMPRAQTLWRIWLIATSIV